MSPCFSIPDRDKELHGHDNGEAADGVSTATGGSDGQDAAGDPRIAQIRAK